MTGGSTITGTVKTSSDRSSKARIIAHTEDYLFWFDHADPDQMDLRQQPPDAWLIFAELLLIRTFQVPRIQRNECIVVRW